MSQKLRALSVLKNLKVMIAYMFLREEHAAWFERAVQPRIYRWNKFRFSLKRNFGSFGVDWERRMIKEFGNSTEDSSESGFGRYEGASPFNAPRRMLEMIVMIVVMMVMIRRILRKSLIGLKPKRRV